MTIPKKSPEERKRVLSFSLDPDVVDWLEEKTTRDSRSQFVNDVLSNHMSQDTQVRIPDTPRLEQVEDALKKGETVHATKDEIKTMKTIAVVEYPRKRGRPRKDKYDPIKRLEQELRK